ncbi:hypothetical protein [Oceanidesulfovibrio marinus]|uniref:hypothetical protein n=1 Tax=Oceanidesulfovibrio marinus TaxID=370038 RepID=UPI001294768C|nr:hypothetical protein [Oceanidesulfovibrio marinus]
MAAHRLANARRIKREFLNVIYLHLAESCPGTRTAALYLREAKSLYEKSRILRGKPF